jgi:tetratricopeptide (TPR) repeat protein
MMDGYRLDENETQIFQNALGMSDTAFFSQFSAWAQHQISTWGYDPATDDKYDALRAQAEHLIEDKNYPQAVDVWKKIAALRPVDELPHKRLAGLYLQLHQNQNAIAELKILDDLSLKNNAYAKAIARLYAELADWPAARDSATRAVWINPYDMQAHQLLASAYEKLGDTKSAEHERDVIRLLHP